MSANAVSLVQEVEYLAAERARQAARGPEFVIFHLRIHDGSNKNEDGACVPSEEEIVSVMLRNGAKVCPLPLSPSCMVVFDVLASFRLARSAAQIASDAGDRISTHNPHFQVRSVKLFIRRIREQMQSAFDEVGLKLDTRNVLRSEQVDGRGVAYRLVAIRRWVHISKKRTSSERSFKTRAVRRTLVRS
jgi:hypothetical protein